MITVEFGYDKDNKFFLNITGDGSVKEVTDAANEFAMTLRKRVFDNPTAPDITSPTNVTMPVVTTPEAAQSADAEPGGEIPTDELPQ